MKKRGLSLLAGGVVLLLVLLGIGAVFVWIRVAALKNQLAENLGPALGAKVEVVSLALDLWKGEVHAAGVTLTNLRTDTPWDRAEIGQATVHFHLADFFAPVQPLEVEVTSWHLVLRSTASQGEVPAPETAPAAETTAQPQSLARHGVEVTRLTAQDGEVEIDFSQARQMTVHGVSFEAENNGAGTWTTQVRVTSLSSGTLQTGAGSVTIRADAQKIVFSGLRVQCDPGMVTGDGEIATDVPHTVKATLQATDVPVAMLLSAPWQMKLSGLANGNLVYQGDDRGAGAQGQLALRQGKFNVLPFLGALTTLVGLPDITGVEVDKATANFAWKDHVLHLTQIDVRKNDVVRIAGDVDVDAEEQVDGRLKVGLPNVVAAKWPQLQAAVFSTPANDYAWTDVHLTGTPDHLQEDLSARLLAVGVQSGSGLINQGTQKAMDLLKSFMGP